MKIALTPLEPLAEIRTLTFVTKRRLEDLDLGLDRSIGPPHQRAVRSRTRRSSRVSRLGAGGRLAAAECGKPFADELVMPVGDGHLLKMRGQMIPECLNVFELLVGRKLVKPGRGNRRLCYAATTSASPLHSAGQPATTTIAKPVA